MRTTRTATTVPLTAGWLPNNAVAVEPATSQTTSSQPPHKSPPLGNVASSEILPGDHMISLNEVAAMLGVSKRGVYRLISRGVLPPPIRIGGASRMLASELANYILSAKANRCCSNLHAAMRAEEMN